jgi:hypothetical protein
MSWSDREQEVCTHIDVREEQIGVFNHHAEPRSRLWELRPPSACATSEESADRRGRETDPGALDHGHAELALAAQHLADAAGCPKDRDQIRTREPMLIHEIGEQITERGALAAAMPLRPARAAKHSSTTSVPITTIHECYPSFQKMERLILLARRDVDLIFRGELRGHIAVRSQAHRVPPGNILGGMRIHVDHRATRQLVDGGPWIFWRQRADGAREGLFLELFPCDNRQCACHEVRVIGQIVGENLEDIDATRDGLVLTYRERAPATSRTQGTAAVVSFETGEVQMAAEEPETAAEDRVLTWLADELDGELLDRLYDEWLHAKGWRRRETHHEGTWAGEWKAEPRRLVSWHEVFPDSRQDMYLIDGSLSLAVDHYCINPTCRCREVRVALLAPGRSSSRRWTQFGDVLFDLDSPSATRFTPFAPATRQLVSAVGAALQERYEVVEHYSRRLDRLKEAGRVLQRAAAAPSTPVTVSSPARAGRNEPCPCGSGKKYKKCCLNTAG